MIAGLWHALDFSRRLTMNLIFLLIVIIVLIAIFSSTGGTIKAHTALVLDPEGAVVEQFSSSPADRALASAFAKPNPEVQLRDLLQTLDAAANDKHIDRVLLITHKLTGIGPATARTLAAALARFKLSGKPLYAFANSYDQRSYLLAAQANQVFLDPDGAVLLEGMARYRTYFKDAFDKLGIEAHLFRVGEYKSAGEPYIRSDQSPEAEAADQYWMNDIWNRHLADIAKARKLTPAGLTAVIDDYVEGVAATQGDLAQLAVQQGLVDGLKTATEVEAMMLAEGVADDAGDSFRQIDFAHYLNHLQARPQFPGKSQVAVLVTEGEIVDGKQRPGSIGGDSTSALLRDIRLDENIKALVLRVDSPGGSVFPSEQIRREVALIKAAGLPVVVSMGDLAASGGYWISMDADEIIADPSTITGSIGIYGLVFNVPAAMGKLGLHSDGVGTTWLAGAFDPTRALDPRVGEMIQQVLNKGYADFIGKVAAARKQTPEAIDGIARGRVWTGAQAKERGLVDRLGTLDDAIAAAAKRAGLKKYDTRYIEQPATALEAFFASMAQSGITGFLREQGLISPLFWQSQAQHQELARVQALIQSRRRSGLPISLQAHCECGLP
ncbi:MAG: signal peptide peptidase SppA [Lysobacterales bacterium CG02_land_8_20_14_3_00_62_12]|nr:MAG: signal peptide peptidase SppA [Xanthomonadales bacterium CG02_land_8_20_14_3_00_62_12]